MEKISLQKVNHNINVGMKCHSILPNINNDCILVSEEGKEIGFFIKKLTDKGISFANLANHEFLSPNVDKTLLERSDVLKAQHDLGVSRKIAKKIGTIQMSTIIGSVPPKAVFRRYSPTISSVHLNKKSANFIKAMLMLCRECESILHDILPEQYEAQKNLLSQVDAKWKLTDLFTSSISNYNIAASYHKDTGNVVGAVNFIITKRINSTGGNLNVPDYNATFDQNDSSLLVYPAWRNIHGVTPIIPTYEGGYRNSLVFYALKAFVGIGKENKQVDHE